MSINITEFLKRFHEEYDFLYNNDDNVAGFDEAMEAFDWAIQDRKFADFVGEFVRYRGDFISSDREAAAFMFALEHFVNR